MQEDSVLRRRYSYAERVLKNYMDTYIKFYREVFGKYPQVDAEISEELSACFFGEKDEDGCIQWKYVE